MSPITITAREVYDAVIRLTVRFDVLIAQHSKTQAEVGDHEGRLRSLEKARWPLPSAALLLSLAAFFVPLFIR